MQDLYDDSGDAMPTAATAPKDQSPEGEQDDEQQSGLLPRSFFGSDVKVGDVCEIKVEQVNEDDVMVSYVSKDEENEPESPSEDKEMAPPESAGESDEGGMY